MMIKALLSVVLVASLIAPAWADCPAEGNCSAARPSKQPCSPQQYRKTAKRINHQDTYHGIKVADPYRWLEGLESPATKSWIASQNETTAKYFNNLRGRKVLQQHLETLQNYERTSAPRKRGENYFYTYNSGLQNQNVLYVTNKLGTKGRVLLDPNTLSKDGTVALDGLSISPDGQWIAYGLAESGSDWNVWRVRNVASGQDLPDKLEWVKFSSASWTKDSLGFLYSRYPAPTPGQDLKAQNQGHTVYYHRIKTGQADDKVVYGFADHPLWCVSGSVSEDGRWLIISGEPNDNDNTVILVHDITKPESGFRQLPNGLKAKFYPIEVEDGRLFVYSNYQAPRFRILSIDLEAPLGKYTWTEVIPQQTDAMETASRVGDKIFVNYLHNACSKIVAYNFDGSNAGEVSLPGLGSAGGFEGLRQDTKTYFIFTSYNSPSSIYEYDLSSGKTSLYLRPKVSFNPDDYETKQVFFTSKDGTQVPMFISSRKDLKPNGNIPVLMYGYGGFSISLTPGFSTMGMTWMEMGGAYVVVNLRGGSEYGEEWHLAGTKTQKQNVFDDFMAAGQWLIDNGYTRRERLAIMGESNGGLLVGACLAQHPEMFGAAVAQVGVMDMLRFSKFTIGAHWTADYGDVDKLDEFKALYAYSPYHNMQKGINYPATLITTADHDDRVFPAHSYKFAAAMQYAQTGNAPVLIRIETKAGHGAGKPIAKRLAESADVLAFLAKTLRMKLPEH